MTNEEAREVLGDVSAYLASQASLENEMLAGHTFTDICIAIKTLKQQPCEDCISRDEAIKQCGFGMTNLLIADCLKRLPSVTPSNDAIKEAYIKGYDYGVKDWFKRKTEPCEDCISREAVIEWLKDKDIIKMKNQEENARRELAFLSSVMPQPTRWIPVSERLPEEDGLYLISTCMNCIDTCLFYKDDDEYVWVDYEESVIAWMPLPKPYAESEE